MTSLDQGRQALEPVRPNRCDVIDERRAFAALSRRIRRYRAEGSPVPAVLARLERDYLARFAAISQGR